jgi:hypothetical protein
VPVISAIVRRRTWEYHLGHWERLPLAELPVQEIRNLRAEVRFWLPQSASPPEFSTAGKVTGPGRSVASIAGGIVQVKHAVLTLLLFAGPLLAQTPPAPGPAKPAVALPATLKFTEGARVEIKVDTTAKRVTWDKFPAGLTADQLEDGKRLLVWAPPGSYAVRANVVNAAGDVEYAVGVLEIAPLIPPAPPLPPDKLVSDLKALAAGSDKGQLKTLAALYRQAATFAADSGFASTSQLINAIHAAADKLLVAPGALTPIRDRVRAELYSCNVPQADVPLTPEIRKCAGDVYARAAAAVEDAAK